MSAWPWAASVASSGARQLSSRTSNCSGIRRRARSSTDNAISARTACTASACTNRSEEHTSELQSLMRISYAVFCLKKKQTFIITQHKQVIQQLYTTTSLHKITETQ